MKRKTAYKYGFAMGRAEHKVARTLGVMLVITAISFMVGYFHMFWTLFAGMLSIVNIIIWLNYWLNHKTEKYFHTKAHK